MIFYESPFRVTKTLEQLAALLGAERRASVSRELTKKFEETLRGTLSSLMTISKHMLPGESSSSLWPEPHQGTTSNKPVSDEAYETDSSDYSLADMALLNGPRY